MVGLVLVSHSRALATAVRELVLSMSGPDLRIAVAAGTGEDRAELGTDATEILDGISAVMSEEGVLLMLDIGSAVLSAETALGFLDESQRAKVRCSGAPFVEGAVAAGVQAALGANLEEVSNEAEGALRHKSQHLGGKSDSGDRGKGPNDGIATATERGELNGEVLVERVVVRNAQGLHARPAARLIREAARYDCSIAVRNLTAGRGPASAKSMSGLASLQVLQGHEIEIGARGPDAEAALQALRAAVEAGLGERPDAGPAPPLPFDSPSIASLANRQAVGVSRGIAIGPLFFAHPPNEDVPPDKTDDPAKETEKLRSAIRKAKTELVRDETSLRKSLGNEEAEIFRAQELILDDPALLETAERSIEDDHQNAAAAWLCAYQTVASAYEQLENEYMRQRAADVVDMGHRVLQALGIPRRQAIVQPKPGILVTEDLTPAEVANLQTGTVLGVICLQGGKTSHAAILLRARGVPAIARAESFFEPNDKLSEGSTVVAFDGESGELWLNPAADALRELRKRKEKFDHETKRVARLSHKPAVTKDGHAVRIFANLSDAADAPGALAKGAEGIGLFRTEFLFVDRNDVPGEQEQFEALEALRMAMGRRPVVVRTLDIGGDKEAPGLHLPPEQNPFLGVRAIRLCLNRRELFRVHLRAILRAAHGGNFHLTFPMITDPQELREALSELESVHAALHRENCAHAWPLPVGVMVEVPAAALLIDQIAGWVDFFSIGSNDLTQYVLAADRDHPELARFQDALHPAVLRLIRRIVVDAHKHGKHVGVCGEAASDPAAACLLVGLGTDELSLNPAMIPKIKDAIRSIGKSKMERIAKKALGLAAAAEVRALPGLEEFRGLSP